MGKSPTAGSPPGGDTAVGERFGHLIERRDNADFPFYNGKPAALSTNQLILAWASVAVGFAALVLLPDSNNVVSLIPRILFVAIPLAVLAVVTKDHWSALFHKVKGRDVLVMIGFAALNILVTCCCLRLPLVAQSSARAART